MCYKTDKIAILIATYNGEHYFNELLESLLNQNESNWVGYIHDDGSTDRTVKIAKEYSEQYPDHFVVIDGEPTGGAKYNFFYLLRNVEAPIYMCCDQDDVWLPDKIEKTLCEMDDICSDDIPCLVHTDLIVTDENLNVVSESMNKLQKLKCCDSRVNHILAQNIVTGCTMMFNRKLRDMIVRVQNIDSIIMHDWWASLIAAYFGKISFLEEGTVLYRQHIDNCVGAKKFGFDYMRKRIVEKNIRKAINNTKKQALEMTRVFSLPDNSSVYNYALSIEKNKFQRLWCYARNGIHKSNFSRNIGLLFWG